MSRLSLRYTSLLPLALAMLGAPAWADSATWSQQVITPEIALKAAQAAKAECQKRGWQVSVTVADPAGLPLVMLRDRYAGWHTVEIANGKARTAASWREATSTVAARVTRPDAAEKAILSQPGVVMIGGGIPITSAGQMVGTIGVSGAPGGDNDDVCAKAGIAVIEADLAF
jgi:uncharacterized protein GlcG (DUF336 family)